MTVAHHTRIALLALATALTSFSAIAAKVGEALPSLTLKDQFGTAHTLDNKVRRIYAYADRSSGDVLKAATAGMEQAQLDAQQAIVITNISDAPGFVKRLILSGLKDRRYAVWVDPSGSSKSLVPSRPDQVTVMDIEQSKVTAIRYVGKKAELQAELKQALKTAQ